MKHRIIIALFWIICLSYPLSAQMEIALSSGYGSYAMSSLKFFQSEAGKQGSIQLYETTTFPPFWNYNLRIGFKVTEKIYAGNIFGFMSTGARSSVADYSGFFFSDINMLGIKEGLFLKYQLYETKVANKPLAVSLMTDISILYTTAQFTDSLKIYDTSITESFRTRFNSIGLYTEPLLILNYEIIPHLNLEIGAGGALNHNLPLYYQNFSNSMKYKNRKIRPNWSGFRLQAGIAYRF